ncbi:MAG: hypothetical protein JW951_00160 [Lentisphaerae bacterium]|nr:hypothetical protein [Lentisphaerota bacterium]
MKADRAGGKTTPCAARVLSRHGLPGLAAAATLWGAAAGAAEVSAADPIASRFWQDKALYAGDTNMLVRRGVLADRRERLATVWARATGIGAKDPIEFFLIGLPSAHDYEAIAVTPAKAEAIHEALTFIGVQPGHPVRPERREYWPKGERVVAHLSCPETDPPIGPVRLERLIWNRRENAPMPESGLVFVGSYRIDAPDRSDHGAYAADARAPFSIASNYNEPTTVLDVPRRAPQGEVYELQYLNPRYVLPTQALVKLTFRPERPPADPRVADLRLDVRAAPAGTRGDPAAPRFSISRTDGSPLVEDGTLNDMLAAFLDLREQARDPFVSVHFADGLRLAALRAVCGVLESIDTENGIRIEPPPPGQLYYRALLPDPAYRNRAARYTQPWELELTQPRGAPAPHATLVRITEHWPDAQALKPELEAVRYPVPEPSALGDLLRRHGPGLPVILVFAEPDMAYGTVMRYLRPVLDAYPTIYVFTSGRSGGPARPGA